MKKEVNKKEIRFKKRIIFCIGCLIFVLIIISYLIINFINNKDIGNKNEVNFDIKNEDVYIDGDTKIFKGENPNNYVVFNKLLFRIISINKDNSLDIISNDEVNILMNKDNDIDKYLNEVFLNNIDKKDLTKVTYCKDKISKIEKRECQNIDSSNYVRLPSIEDIINSIDDGKSYLLNDRKYWLNNYDNNMGYTVSNGKIIKTNSDELLEVRPVIRLNNNIKVISGDGSKDNPYIVNDYKDITIGDYVKIDNDIWNVYDTNNGEVGLYLSNGLTKMMAFGKSNKYNLSDKDNIGYYLNNNYLEGLSYKNIINNHKWDVGNYKNSYKDIYKETVKAKIGMLSTADLKLNNDNELFYLISPKDDNTVYLYDSEITDTKINLVRKIVPTIYIDKNRITSGDGSKDNPYVVGVE